MPRFPDDYDKGGRALMLEDIAGELAATRWETGLDALAPQVLDAMATVPREAFVPADVRYLAFRNGPVGIGHSQTISQPFIVALMTQLLAPRAGQTILEVGTGSGYQAAVLAQLVRQVFSVEIIAALAHEAAPRLARLGYANVEVRHGDGYEGWPEHAPYDGIIVTAAAPAVPPPLVEQLKPGARLVIPVGLNHAFQTLKLIEKHADGGISSSNVLTVAFVPLTRDLRDD
ncbi:protein-L-isoaspartate(D-aspartate) O-methyltransferase [Zoogloea sp.]|uniref:protein-L-isoaspartate(D-aspartate) O-methyltransferase n=1 Tax=Zoogloea sp. TaxID=49181 RepID=UPI0035B46AA3